jgi:hypothetical protein
LCRLIVAWHLINLHKTVHSIGHLKKCSYFIHCYI